MWLVVPILIFQLYITHTARHKTHHTEHFPCCHVQKPQTHHPTVLDMMEVGDLEVRNALIDQCHVDTDLLIEKRLEAERVIEVERPRGANVVRYVA